MEKVGAVIFSESAIRVFTFFMILKIDSLAGYKQGSLFPSVHQGFLHFLAN